MNSKTYKIIITKYDGDLKIVKDIALLIDRKYSELFHSVIVHGSVATNEVIPYSDFDGLLIVKDKFVNSKKLVDFKLESMKLILKFDPLQHHGWFQIKESQLQDYPQDYLPYEVLTRSKLIFPNMSRIELTLAINEEKVDYKKDLSQLIKSIEKQALYDFKSMRLYELKSFLSKVMLLPTMYYSAKTNQGIFKKESFKIVKEYFNAEEWSCIDTASRIRSSWSYKLYPLQRLVMKRPERVFRKLTKYVAPHIDVKVQGSLTPEFFKSLNMFIQKVKMDI